MNASLDRPLLRRQGFVFLWLTAVGQAVAADGETPRPKYSPTERMTPARLKAAHDDVLTIGRMRRPLPSIPDLNDYRAILHAHAEDSAHTGGTRMEMLADAKLAGVHAILLTDHFRPPKDFVADSWRGLRNGVLFLPGSEDRGFLIYPSRSIIAQMKDPTPAFIALTKGHKPGDVLARLDVEPYHRSFRNLSTHILARTLDEASIRSALRNGHAYVSHDWMCDPTGSLFELIPATDGLRYLMGDEVRFADDQRLVARFPVPCRIRLLRCGRLIAESSGDRLDYKVTAPGVYRIEGWLQVGGEERPWFYSNPIYVRWTPWSVAVWDCLDQVLQQTLGKGG